MKPVSEVRELFRRQRAIRSFTDEDVPDALVDQVLTAAIHGPSGSNTQPWHFIVIRDQAVKRAVSEVYEEARADAYRDRPPSASGPRQPLSAAPVLIVACVDTPTSGQAGFEILGIPENVESAAIIPVGWPDREYGPNRRPPLERFVMRDRWSR